MRGFICVLGLIIVLSGCTTTQKAAGVGAAGGAVLGGVIGHQSDHGTEGAAIGAVLGGLGGMVVGERMDKKFCPKCGREFGMDYQICPIDGTELKVKEK